MSDCQIGRVLSVSPVHPEENLAWARLRDVLVLQADVPGLVEDGRQVVSGHGVGCHLESESDSCGIQSMTA